MPKAANPIYAIGYSNLSVSKFISLLKAHSVNMLIDVRTIPKSRHQPGFNGPALASRLKKRGIKYMHFKELGGLRRPSKDSINIGWRNESFRGFADYMQTRAFASAVLKLIGMSKDNTARINEVLLKVLCHNIVVLIHEMNEFDIKAKANFTD